MNECLCSKSRKRSTLQESRKTCLKSKRKRIKRALRAQANWGACIKHFCSSRFETNDGAYSNRSKLFLPFGQRIALSHFRQLQYLSRRIGSLYFAFVTRAHVQDQATPGFVVTGNASDFIQEVFGMPPSDLLLKFEQWVCAHDPDNNK